MTKYVCVKARPESVGKDEHVVVVPDFLDEVRECRYPIPNGGAMSHLYLRAIVDHIGTKFDPMFPGSSKLNANDYQGIPVKSDVDVARLVVRVFKSFYPQIFDMAIEAQIKQRPFGTKLIYFVGDHLQTTPFARNGVDVIDEKDIPQYMGKKHSKSKKLEEQ